MSHEEGSGQAGIRVVTVDVAVAVLIFALGALVAWDSARLGASWGADGPESGYFPFYVGVILCICSAVVFVQGLLRIGADRSVFVTFAQLKQVLIILVPSTFYVLGVQLVGIYVSSAVFIALFMRVIGRYTWFRSVAVGLGVSLCSFMMFEIWFKIPLPKGPLENLIGY